MAIPLIFNTILVLLSSFLPLVFSIGEGNTYQRESLFWVPFAIANGYLLLSTLFVLVNRRKILREEFIPLVLFALFPVIGSLVQGLLYGVLLMWSATAFSLTLVFTFLQGRMRQIDGLTKTWFRSSFDNFIDEILRGNPKATFGLICFDLDNLKIINDRFGHLEGDFALEKACEIVRKVTDNRHVIARRGGDEFFMYVDTDQVDQLYTIVELIHKDLESFNQTSHKLFPLHCSFGYGIFQGEKQTYKSFLRKIDEEMYLNKNRKISYKPHN